VGVPAALAWGMEGLHSEDQSFSEVAGCPAALASSRTTHRSKIVMIIQPLQMPNRAPDYFVIVPRGSVRVTRLVGSFGGVLRAGTSVPAHPGGPKNVRRRSLASG
jgi:hypothetical protein